MSQADHHTYDSRANLKRKELKQTGMAPDQEEAEVARHMTEMHKHRKVDLMMKIH